jgi:hypothetical protein
MPGPGARITANPAVACAHLQGEAVLLNLETGAYVGVDPVGTRIWGLIGEGASEAEIVARLLEIYDVEADRLRADVATFLAGLAARGLATGVEQG